MYRNIPEIMTFKECQELLRVGKNTLLELLHTRQIEGFRIGNRWRITKESVVEFIERRWRLIIISYQLIFLILAMAAVYLLKYRSNYDIIMQLKSVI